MRSQSWQLVMMFTFTSLVMVAGILWLLARFLFQADVTYRQMMIVKGYALMIAVAQMLFGTFVVLARHRPVVHTGSGILVSPEMATSFVGRRLSAITVFERMTP